MCRSDLSRLVDVEVAHAQQPLIAGPAGRVRRVGREVTIRSLHLEVSGLAAREETGGAWRRGTEFIPGLFHVPRFVGAVEQHFRTAQRVGKIAHAHVAGGEDFVLLHVVARAVGTE